MTKNDNFKEYGMPVVVLVAICCDFFGRQGGCHRGLQGEQ